MKRKLTDQLLKKSIYKKYIVRYILFGTYKEVEPKIMLEDFNETVSGEMRSQKEEFVLSEAATEGVI